MLQKLFDILFVDSDDTDDCYLECTINHDNINTGDTLVLEEREYGSCTGRAFRVQVTDIIEDALCEDLSNDMVPVDSSLIASDRQTKQKAETWSIPTFMI